MDLITRRIIQRLEGRQDDEILQEYTNPDSDKYHDMAKNEASNGAQGVDNAIAQIVSSEEQDEEVDDLELIAVITAAIAASENTSTDGLVVRSIRKVNSRRK